MQNNVYIRDAGLYEASLLCSQKEKAGMSARISYLESLRSATLAYGAKALPHSDIHVIICLV